MRYPSGLWSIDFNSSSAGLTLHAIEDERKARNAMEVYLCLSEDKLHEIITRRKKTLEKVR